MHGIEEGAWEQRQSDCCRPNNTARRLQTASHCGSARTNGSGPKSFYQIVLLTLLVLGFAAATASREANQKEGESANSGGDIGESDSQYKRSHFFALRGRRSVPEMPEDDDDDDDGDAAEVEDDTQVNDEYVEDEYPTTYIISPDGLSLRTRGKKSYNHLLRGKKSAADLMYRGQRAAMEHLLRGKKSPANHLLRGKKTPANHLLRGKKSPANHLLRGKKSPANHLLRGKKSSVDLMYRGQRAAMEHLLRGKKSPANHLLRGKKEDEDFYLQRMVRAKYDHLLRGRRTPPADDKDFRDDSVYESYLNGAVNDYNYYL